MIKNFYSGKFIVLEGLDGSGQSSQVALLGEFLSRNGYDVIKTKEPTRDSEAGKRINEILEGQIEMDPLEFQKLYTQDRKEHLDNIIIPALKQGTTVISDRYFFSTFAFGTAHGSNLEELIKLNDNFLYPDATFLLGVDPKVCIERIEKRADPRTLFEKQEKLAKVWDVYKTFPSRFENVHLIDGEKSIQEVFQEIKTYLKTIL